MTLLQVTPDAPLSTDAPTMRLDLVALFNHAAWPIKMTIGLLVGCSLLVWIISLLKFMQLARLRSTQSDFDRRTQGAGSMAELVELAQSHRSPGARVIGQLYTRGAGAQMDRLRALAERAIVADLAPRLADAVARFTDPRKRNEVLAALHAVV